MAGMAEIYGDDLETAVVKIFLVKKDREQKNVQPAAAPQLRPLFAGEDFPSDILIDACGEHYGDERCDMYSPLDVPTSVGRDDPSPFGAKLSEADKRKVARYLEDINLALGQ